MNGLATDPVLPSHREEETFRNERREILSSNRKSLDRDEKT